MESSDSQGKLNHMVGTMEPNDVPAAEGATGQKDTSPVDMLRFVSHPNIGVEGQFLIQLCRTRHLWSLLSLQNKATDVQPVLWDGSTAQRRYKTIFLNKFVFIF